MLPAHPRDCGMEDETSWILLRAGKKKTAEAALWPDAMGELDRSAVAPDSPLGSNTRRREVGAPRPG
jgi:hypothetical protein